MRKSTKTNDGITAIYVRRSVSDKDKGNNSLSISAQKEECIRFVGECDYRIYCDDGKSGKDVMHRPAFMQMMSDAREGLISRIIVKKYDRFSRNMREYLNITDELDRYGVTVRRDCLLPIRAVQHGDKRRAYDAKQSAELRRV